MKSLLWRDLERLIFAAIMYYIVYGFLFLFSLLPLPVLYLFSDFAYFLVYYVFGYRKDVVLNNLRSAFPEKTEKERRRIAQKFYHNLMDTFIETIKMISVTEKFLDKRVNGNWEAVNQFFSTGRNIQLFVGHNFNWEWANDVAVRKTQFPFLAVYMRISNKIFDRLMYKMRSRSGTILLQASKMREAFLPYRDKQHLLALAADQNPGDPAKAYWIQFLGRPAPFVKGPEKGAKTNNSIVVFAFIKKIKRGYYEVGLEVEGKDSITLPEGELTKRFVYYLQDVIRKYPDMWLWSHRRWKWEWKEEYGPVMQ
jgi:KDO2-lipid IV(A) lauroyltransferase